MNMRLTIGQLRQVIREEVVRARTRRSLYETGMRLAPPDYVPDPGAGYRGDFAQRTNATGHPPERNNKEGAMGYKLRTLAKDILQDANKALGVPWVDNSDIRGQYPESELVLRDGNRYQVPTKTGTTKSAGASWKEHLENAMRDEGHDETFIEGILGLLNGTIQPMISNDPSHPPRTYVIEVDGETYLLLPGGNSLFVHESEARI